MNIKSNKGLSMIAVIIVLAVIIATVVETIIIVNKWTKQEELEDITTTMLLIQARCKTYEDKETMDETEAQEEKSKKDKKDDKDEEKENEIEIKLKGTLVKKVEDNELVNILIEKEVIKKKDKYYLLSTEDLEDLHVYDVPEEQVYLVNYSSKEVIYANGIEKDGKTVYKLSEIKEQ